ncbi:MAG: hypothetical protein IPN86_17900 [Saprospiraceae bacterium]|nr:hypothetical protein [Saprospiraceae bacterium]
MSAGGSNSIQLSDAVYITLKVSSSKDKLAMVSTIDDGTLDTPTHHIQIVNCIFRNINATGITTSSSYQDWMIFEIRNCTF